MPIQNLFSQIYSNYLSLPPAFFPLLKIERLQHSQKEVTSFRLTQWSDCKYVILVFRETDSVRPGPDWQSSISTGCVDGTSQTNLLQGVATIMQKIEPFYQLSCSSAQLGFMPYRNRWVKSMDCGHSVGRQFTESSSRCCQQLEIKAIPNDDQKRHDEILETIRLEYVGRHNKSFRSEAV